jgi:hypothetical protein
MSDDRTVVKPSAPLFKIKDTVYAIVSASKGFIEPLYVYTVEFDPSRQKYLYGFVRTLAMQTPQKSDFLPAKLYEDQIINLCGALEIQVSVLQRQYDTALKLFQEKCSATGSLTPYVVPRIYEDKQFKVQPPAPRFGVNDVVYLTDTAASTGVLEALRVNNMEWDNERKMWLYKFILRPRPERHMTIGDADNWHNPKIVCYHEDSLSTFCEAQQTVVSFLNEALTACKNRIRMYCGATS